MDNATARVLGGVYIALCAALSDEGVRLANDVLFGIADSPILRPEDKRIWRLIAESATADSDKLREQMQEDEQRPKLCVVAGGAA